MLDDESTREWCTKNQKNPVKATVAELADFFIYSYLHEERNSKSDTITGNRSVIASINKDLSNCSISNNSELSKLTNGIYNSEPTVDH